jgi:predicted ATPase
MAYFQNRYKIRGLYLLDEPETALSARSQLAFLSILAKTSQSYGAQFIIATHSPILLACPEAVIYDFDGEIIQQIQYEDTAHYRIYKDFMEDRKPFLQTED